MTKQFQNILGAFRVLRGKTQAELARSAGISQSFISLLEAGLRHPTPETAKRIAKVLKNKPSTIFPKIKRGNSCK